MDLMELAKQQTTLEMYQKEDGLRPLIDAMKKKVNEFEHDVTTVKGRNATKSFSNNVRKMKVFAVNSGKGLTADMKAKCKVIDASIRVVKEEFDILSTEARKPLTDWEEADKIEKERIAEEEAEATALVEQERIEEEARVKYQSDYDFAILFNEKIDRENAERLAQEKRDEEEAKRKEDAESIEAEHKAHDLRVKVGLCHDMALIMNVIVDRDREDARIIKEREEAEEEKNRVAEEKRIQIEHDEKIKKEAATQAEADKLDAIEAQRLAEEREKNAKAKAAKDAGEAEAKRLRDIETARKEEIAKENTRKAKIAEEERIRASNEEHVKSVKNRAYFCLTSNGVTEDQARLVVELISKNKVDNVTIQF